MAALVALLIAGVGLAAWVAESSLRSDTIDRTEKSLSSRARLLADRFAHAPAASLTPTVIQGLTERAANAGKMRVAVFDAQGLLLGAAVPGAPDRANVRAIDAPKNGLAGGRFPEVAAALAGQARSTIRAERDSGLDVLYHAIPVAREGGGALRVGVPLSGLDDARWQLRRRFALTGVIGTGFVVMLSWLISRSALRPIREVRLAAEAIARGELDERPPIYASDELAEISNAVREIARQLRRQLEEATGEKEQLRAVLESMVEGVLVVDPRGRIVIANSRLREFFGMDEDVEGRPFLEAIRQPDLDEVLGRVEASDETVVRKLKLREPPRTLRVQAIHFSRGPTQERGTVAVFHDISEVERIEEVRRDFVANASHELRTPLTAIQGFSETLLNSEIEPEKRRSYLEIIDRHARRLGAIVNDLLSLSTTETGQVRHRPVALDVAETVRSTIVELESRWGARDLKVTCSSDGETTAVADTQALIHILTNLLDNAIKYTDPGDSIEVRVVGDPDRVRASVADTGIGIPIEDQARIFERFFRVDRARSRALGGTGLGLSIVRHLVRAQGGEISVESTPGEGTTFSFSLPTPNSAENTD